ncbi:MAG TPA: hypothetical protein VGO50_03835 [Pyrinomonadaceae bacterium]|jgi:hypothetical protein|nr:hypothetical protein [Pyrinomonadaceae bacterium]
MFKSKKFFVFSFVMLGVFAGCRPAGVIPQGQAGSLHNVPAQRLSYSVDTDALPPLEPEQPSTADERVAAVQADFDQNRPQELLDKTLPSPDKQRVLVIYHRAGDKETEFRLDMYAADGKLIGHVSPDSMAISLPDAIAWAPDGSTAAFIGVTRAQSQIPATADAPTPPEVEPSDNAANTAANIDGNIPANSSGNANTNVPAPPVQTSAPIKIFANEQIYTCNKEGADLKYISQRDTLIYFYLLWSPDSTMLATLACTPAEWQYGELAAKSRAEEFRPFGRPRLIEKIGRERLLDDNLTVVHPVWSPDSAKMACAFDKDIKIYDSIGELPTIAAIPLRIPLLTSSQRFDQLLREELKSSGNSNAPSNLPVPTPTPEQGVQVMPNESDLVSFNPIVELRWTDEKTLYFKTGYIKEMLDSRYSSYSYMRWHKLNFSAQAQTQTGAAR